MVAGGAVETLAGKLASLAVVARLAGLLTTPSLVAVGAHAGTCDGVALRPVLALAAITAVRSPEVTLTAWRHTERRHQTEYDTAAFALDVKWMQASDKMGQKWIRVIHVMVHCEK